MDNSVYIACDNEDKILGHFFQSCADNIRKATVDNGLSYEAMGTDRLTKETINTCTGKADEYVFCAFSHGTDTALVCKGKSYVEAGDNVCNFYRSVFFTFACHTAKGIGREFDDVCVLGYFGYNNRAWVIPAYEDVFVKCATSGLVSYLQGHTLKQARQEMIDEYDRQLKRGKVNLTYSYLLKNKQALVAIINNEDKTIKD